VTRLGAIELSEEDATYGVLQAREQLAAERESLARMPELRVACSKRAWNKPDVCDGLRRFVDSGRFLLSLGCEHL
jgi:hypothetical protein